MHQKVRKALLQATTHADLCVSWVQLLKMCSAFKNGFTLGQAYDTKLEGPGTSAVQLVQSRLDPQLQERGAGVSTAPCDEEVSSCLCTWRWMRHLCRSSSPGRKSPQALLGERGPGVK